MSKKCLRVNWFLEKPSMFQVKEETFIKEEASNVTFELLED